MLRFNQQSTFAAFLGGAIFIASTYAIFAAGGLSILSAIFFLLLIYITGFSIRAKQLFGQPHPFKIWSRELFYALIIFSLVFVYQLFYFYDCFNKQALSIAPDYTFYSRLASDLRDTGIENASIELFLDQPTEVSPYHYIEIWFAALISKVFGIHAQYALMLIAFPILYTIIYLGALEIIRVLRRNLKQAKSNFDYLLAALILITVSCGFLYPTSLPFLKSDVWALSVHGAHKVTYSYLIMIAVFLLLYHRKRIETGLMVAVLVICQVNVAPALLIAFSLYLLLNLIFKKINWKQFFYSMLLPLFALLYFAVFYGFQGGNDSISLNTEELLAQFDTKQEWQTLFNILTKTLIQIIISLSPFFIIAYFFHRQSNSSFTQAIQSPEKIKAILKQNDDVKQKTKIPKFAYVKEADEYKSSFYKYEQVWVGHTFSLMRAFDPLIISCISSYNIPIEEPREERFQRNSTFMKYIEMQEERGEFRSYKETQLDFVKTFKVDFLLMSKERGLPDRFRGLYNPVSLGSIDGYAVYQRKKTTK